MNTTSENSRRIERLKKRLENQYPVIGDWIRRQAIRSLERIACPEAVSALSSTVEFSTNPTLKKYVLDALKRIALQPISSTTKTALEAYKVFKVDYGDPDSIAKRETLLEALRGTDSWSTLAAQYALCDVVIKEPNHVLQQFLIQNHFSPPYPHFNLRFLFLTKQFDAADITKHNQADIDFAFGFGYADDITYRVAQVAVEARRLDWAEAALNSVKGLESFHWDAVIEILLESRSESLLWRSLTRIPPIHAATALNRLAERGWRPTSDQRASFEHLLTLANAWPYRSHAITEPAVAVESNWSISSSRDDTVVFFCIDLFVVCEILSSLFMHRQCVLQVRRYSGQKVAKQHTSIGIRGTTFVVSNNGKWLLQGDFDGTVSIRELPSLQLLNSVRAIREAVHTMTVSRNSDVVAICGAASRTNVVLSLPSLQVHAKKASPQVDSSIFDDGAVSITPARSYGTSLMESSRTALRADRLLSVTSDRHLTVLSHFGIHL
ncbi:MAG: hypothetical protein JNL58_27895, partial [Planctomyces sp.]|nr:hypothetical protein [Planctomyces sp.]